MNSIHNWTEEDITFLKNNFSKMPTKRLSEIMQVCENGIRKKAQIFKLKKSKSTLELANKIQSEKMKNNNPMYKKELLDKRVSTWKKNYQEGKIAICDILIPSMNLVIECDGDYWHKYPVGNEIDHIRTSELLAKGFKVLRLWENEIKVMDLNKFKDKIK